MGDPEKERKGGGRAKRLARFTGGWLAGWLRSLWAIPVAIMLALVTALAFFALSGRPIPAPDWAVARLETAVNARLGGAFFLSIGGAQIVVDRDFAPRVQLTRLKLLTPQGAELAEVSDLRATLSIPALTEGRIAPAALRLSGARVELKRATDGSFDVALPQAATGQGGAQPAAQVVRPRQPEITTVGGGLAELDRVLDTPLLRSLRRVQADAMSLTIDDARAGKVWRVGDGRLTLVQTDDQVSIELGFGLANPGGDMARATLTFVTRKDSPEARMAVRVDGMDGGVLAAEAPALAFLRVVRAPISGDFRAAVGPDGLVSSLDGSLDVGAGYVQANKATKPLRFDRGRMVFSYDPLAEKVTFSEASVQSPSLRVKASAQVWLRDMANGLPKSLVGQVRLTQVMVDPEGLFVKPVRFSEGAIDLKLTLDPFDLRLGQLMLLEGPRRIEASGDFTATPEGWKVSLDNRLNQITSSDLLALWPVFVVPQTRVWLAENVQAGLLFNVRSALRLTPGQEPRLSLGYDFSNADVRFLKTLPPIRQGRGYAVMQDKTYTQVVDQGHVTPPEGGDIDVSGSVFEVPDVTVKPPPAVIRLKTRSTITAALSILDQPPFEFLKKSGQTVDLADGNATVDATIRVPLADHVQLPDVNFDVTGTLTDVRSTKLVPNRVVTAPSLHVAVDSDRIAIGGKGRLGVLPVDVTWTQDLRPGQGKSSNLSGTVELSQAAVDEFHLGFPPGTITGTGTGQLSATLEKGDKGSFTLTSDLSGVGISIPAVAWSKPPAAKGRLEVSGALGDPVRIDKLSLSAPGLSADGKVTLNPGGTLNLVRLDRVRLGGWLDAPVDISGRGQGQIAIATRGGSLDLRKAKFGKGGDKGAALPLTLSLDKVTVSNSIALTGFHGSFTTLGGFNGTFTSGINGAAAVAGTVVPTTNGTAVRLRSDDAGAAIGAAGIYPNIRGGSLELTLLPRADAGDYDGTLNIKNIKVVKAPALAGLLEAISIVGLLDQLNGPGILFTGVQADFRLTRDAVEVTKGSAVGPSMGLSAAGLFHLDTSRFDMQGVISPIYFLNQIGSVLTQKGEGLFGFNYTLKGTAADPKISVNPLSLLTPGMFRDIFRSAPPALPGDAKGGG